MEDTDIKLNKKFVSWLLTQAKLTYCRDTTCTNCLFAESVNPYHTGCTKLNDEQLLALCQQQYFQVVVNDITNELLNSLGLSESIFNNIEGHATKIALEAKAAAFCKEVKTLLKGGQEDES